MKTNIEVIMTSQETDAYNMTKTIADATKEQRHAMLTDRLKMISSQPEEQRVQSVKGMVMGMSMLSALKASVWILTGWSWNMS